MTAVSEPVRCTGTLGGLKKVQEPQKHIAGVSEMVVMSMWVAIHKTWNFLEC